MVCVDPLIGIVQWGWCALIRVLGGGDHYVPFLMWAEGECIDITPSPPPPPPPPPPRLCTCIHMYVCECSGYEFLCMNVDVCVCIMRVYYEMCAHDSNVYSIDMAKLLASHMCYILYVQGVCACVLCDGVCVMCMQSINRLLYNAEILYLIATYIPLLFHTHTH